MPEIVDCIKARSSITSLKTTSKNLLAFSTQLHGAKIISPYGCDTKYHFTNQYLNQNTTAVAFNNDATLLAFSNEKIIYIADITKKEIIKIIPTDAYKIQLLVFDDTSNYIIAGNSNGRVIQYSTLSSSAMARLCSFPYNETDRKRIRSNFVSSFCINKNTLACSGLGGTIIIMDIYSRANKIVLQNSRSRINALHFIDHNTILSANFDGLISIFSIKDRKLIKEIETPLTRIRQIVSMPDPNFIMLCSNTKYVSVIDIKNYRVIHNKYIEFKQNVIRISRVDEKHIAASLKDGAIHMIELSSKEDLKSLILHNALDKAYELVEKEPMLKSSQEYEDLEQIYNKTYKQAISALINQNISTANELLKMFKDIPAKKRMINSLFISFRNYDNLKILYAKKKITIAYALVAKFPELEQTPVFRKLEELWRDDFKNAQRQMLQGKTGKANYYLDKYKTIPAKKEMINLILNQNRDFIQFIVALNKKDYAKASYLAKKNKLLTKAPNYSVLRNELEYKIEQIKRFIHLGEVEKAMIAISIIKDVEELKPQAMAFLKECKHLKLLQKNYEKNEFKRCYEVLDKYPHLYNTELGQMLEKHWIALIKKCESHALKGNTENIKQTLGELVMLEGRLEKIGDLFRLSYHVRIKAYLFKRSFKNSEKTIYSYIDIFGIDSEIKILMSTYEKRTKNKLAITHHDTPERNNWVNLI